MRFTVTALGSAGDKPVGVVVGQVARYLIAPDQRPTPGPGTGGTPEQPRPGEESVSRYYADGGDSPGRWLGVGARELDLPDTVEFDAFTSVLAGRNPRTGERLITARGSAGRVASLGAGSVARWSPEGEALYAVPDVAAVLGWSQADVRDAIADGERYAASRLVASVTGRAVPAGPGTPTYAGNDNDRDHVTSRDGHTPAAGTDRARADDHRTTRSASGGETRGHRATGTPTRTGAAGPGQLPVDVHSSPNDKSARERGTEHHDPGNGRAIPAGTAEPAPIGTHPRRDAPRPTPTDGPGRAAPSDQDAAGHATDSGPGPGSTDNREPGHRPGTDGVRAADRDGPGMALVPFIDRGGTRYVSERALSRVEHLADRGLTAAEVLDTGDPDDELTVPAAARLLGIRRGYLSRLCRTYVEHHDEIATALAAGETPKRTYLTCRRTDDGAYRIARAELAAYTERRRRPAVRVGYDVTATTEKSISVLALLGGPQVRREVLAAVETANDTGLRWLEHNAAAARAGGQVVGVAGWTTASFQHLTSRRLDPFVHHHNVVANTVVDEHGDRRALDARPLYRNVAAASALATAQVRWELTRRLGVAWRPARHGGWEIAGITDPVLDEFSQRRREINDAIRELEDALGRASTLDELNTVVAATRPAKTEADEPDLLASWWQRARAYGLTPARLHGTLGHARITGLDARLRARIRKDVATAVTAERSIFTRGDVLAALVDLPHPNGDGPLILSAATLERLADEFLGSTRVVQLERTTGEHDKLQRRDGATLAVGGGAEPEFTTTDVLALQTRILRTYGEGLGDGAGSVPRDALAAALDDHPDLSPEQRGLVAAFCTSGDRAQSAIGRPGTGKTHAIRAAVAAWQTVGYRVLGTAVKAEAARHLGTECDIPAEPLAWYLNRLDDPFHSPLDHLTVLVVDEASTIGDRALDRLLCAVARDRAMVRFIGDPAQHGSVPAGGMWHLLVARHPDRTPELVEGHRVRHAADNAAAEALREGKIPDALNALDAAGHLHVLDSERDLYVALLDRWWTARRNGRPHPMVDRRNDQRLVLNRLARVLRRDAGELGDIEVPAAGDRRFAVGDEVVARMGDRSLHPLGRPGSYVRNGTHGDVVAVHLADNRADDRITVTFHGLGVIDLPRSFFDEHRDVWGRVDVGLDHAYAITSYAVEGLTFDESTSHVDPRSSRPEVYVDITRGRQANHVYLTSAEDHLAGERLPAAPTDPDRVQLEHRLANSGPEHVAIAVDPLAAPAAAYAEGKTLAQLRQARWLSIDDPRHAAVIARAERIREHQRAQGSPAQHDCVNAVEAIECAVDAGMG